MQVNLNQTLNELQDELGNGFHQIAEFNGLKIMYPRRGKDTTVAYKMMYLSSNIHEGDFLCGIEMDEKILSILKKQINLILNVSALTIRGVEDKNNDVGKYGRMWMKYMQEEYPVRYRSLVRFCELHSKAAQVNELAYNPHLSVLDYKKQERAKEVAALEYELEDIGVVIELKEEKIETLDKEIEEKRISYRREQIKAQAQLADTVAENEKKELEGQKLSQINSQLKTEYYETVDALDDTKNELAEVESKVVKMTQAYEVAKDEFEWTQQEIVEAEKLRKELLEVDDAERYLREEVIELRYQNQKLKEENRSLKDKLEKAYEFMKQFVIGGMNLLEKFRDWIGEKFRDAERGR